jgi:hypothetical protein
MEITYKITEADYFRAWKLRRKSLRRFGTLRRVVFWVFILVCLLMLWGVVERIMHTARDESSTAETSNSGTETPDESTATPPGNQGRNLLVNVGPFLLFIGLWAGLWFWYIPHRVRQIYRKDPLMQGQFTLGLTAEQLSVQNTAGTSSKSPWNAYEQWLEGKDVIILIFHSQAYFILPLTGLSEPQRTELRGILATALPKK